MQKTTMVHRPRLTLPPIETEALQDAYAGGRRILEYGSGGSTIMAAEMTGKKIWSVESDRSWADSLRAYFRENSPGAGSSVVVHHVDIGPTKQWGYPVDDSRWRMFANYPLEVWTLPDFEPPDVVLVDGRFRIGCALATAFMTKSPVDLYFDDYFCRPQYHAVEEFLGMPIEIGRMAKFRVEPITILPYNMLAVIRWLHTPN